MRLTDLQLLERCTRGATQNVNEALNSMIWHLCPKEMFCGSQTVETAVYLAVLLFNEGHRSLADVVRRMGCSVGAQLKKNLAMLDQDKEYHRKRKMSDKEKKARKHRRAVKKGFEDHTKETEGETYAADRF